MAFVETYYSRWKDDLLVTHEIKLHEEGGTTPTPIAIPGVQHKACIIRKRGSKKAILESHIIGSELEFNFIIDTSMLAGMEAMFQSAFREWKVEKYYNSVLEWVGYLRPDNFTRPHIKAGDIYHMSLSATDALATLKEIEYVNFSTGSQYTDRVSILTTLKRALEHLGTPLALDFEVQLGTWCTNDTLMTSSELALSKASVDNGRSAIVKEGRLLNEDCYTTIEKVIKDFDVYLFQKPGTSGPVWRIVNPQEKNSNNFSVAWSTLAVTGPTANDLRISLANYSFETRGDLQKIRPFEQVEITYRDRNVQDNLLGNGGFDSGAGWNSSTGWFTAFNTSPGYLRQPGVNYGLSGFDEAPTYIYTDNESITKIEEGDKLRVSFKYRIQSVTPVGSEIFMEPKIYDGSTEYGSLSAIPSSGKLALNESSEWSLYEGIFNFPGSIGTNSYSIRIYVTPKTGGPYYTGMSFEMDDVYWAADYLSGGDLTFDRFWKGVNTDDVFTDAFEDELFYGDAQQDNDIGGYHIGTTRTKTWNRYGKTENINIQVAHGQNILENYARYKDYVIAEIIDPTRAIQMDAILQMESKDYQILVHTIVYSPLVETRVEVELQECLNAAVTTAFVNQFLTSIDGSEDGGSTAVQVPASGSTPTLQQVTDVGATTDQLMTVTKGGESLRINYTTAESGYILGRKQSTSHWAFGALAATEILYIRNYKNSDIFMQVGVTPVTALAIDQSGARVGIFETTPGAKLDVNGNIWGAGLINVLPTSEHSQLDGYGVILNRSISYITNGHATGTMLFRCGGTHSSTLWGARLDASGNFTAKGELESWDTSDIKLKKDIMDLDGVKTTQDLMKLRTIRFFHIEHKKIELGVIAQEAIVGFPEVVKERPSDKKLMVQYGKLIPALLRMNQRQERRIVHLENIIIKQK